MTALVTGATGFIGGNLTRRLLESGVPVRVYVRSRERSALLAAAGAEVVAGAIDDAGALAAALDGVSAVYHLAGPVFRPELPQRTYDDVHGRGAATLVAAIATCPAPPRLVLCSTTGVHGVTGERPAAEDAALAPTNAYERAKLRAEQTVSASGVPWTIVRPGLVYGPGDVHLVGLFRAIARGVFRPIGLSPVVLHPIYVDDLCDALVGCAGDPRALREVFNVAAVPATLAEIAGEIAAALGVAAPHGTIPEPLARGLAAIGDVLPPRWRARAPLHGARYRFLTGSRVYDTTKIERRLGFRAATDLSGGMRRTVAWYRATGALARPSPR
jgi:nucleoside-diphosphate-sugar epimerase